MKAPYNQSKYRSNKPSLEDVPERLHKFWLKLKCDHCERDYYRHRLNNKKAAEGGGLFCSKTCQGESLSKRLRYEPRGQVPLYNLIDPPKTGGILLGTSRDPYLLSTGQVLIYTGLWVGPGVLADDGGYLGGDGIDEEAEEAI